MWFAEDGKRTTLHEISLLGRVATLVLNNLHFCHEIWLFRMRSFMLNFLCAPQRVSTIFHHFLQKLCRKKVNTCSTLIFEPLSLWIQTGLCWPFNAVMFNTLAFARSQASLPFRSWQTPEAALRC